MTTAKIKKKAGRKKAAATSRKKATRKKSQSRKRPVSSAQKKASPTKGGRPPFEPTDEDRKNVQTLAGLGLKQDEIRLLVTNPHTGEPISDATLRRHFSRELETGGPIANSQVAQSLFRKATGNGPAAVTAAIWWTKCRMGWKENSVVEVDVKSGVLVPPPAATPEEWIRGAMAAAAAAQQPGGEE